MTAEKILVFALFAGLVVLIAGCVWLDQRIRKSRPPERAVDGRAEA